MAPFQTWHTASALRRGLRSDERGGSSQALDGGSVAGLGRFTSHPSMDKSTEADLRAIFTAASKAQAAVDYLRGFRAVRDKKAV